jgi:hypothetical protein
MQAGSGGRAKLSVVGSPFSVREEKSFLEARPASVERRTESSFGRCPTGYFGEPTKFHLPQAKDSWTGTK